MGQKSWSPENIVLAAANDAKYDLAESLTNRMIKGAKRNVNVAINKRWWHRINKELIWTWLWVNDLRNWIHNWLDKLGKQLLEQNPNDVAKLSNSLSALASKSWLILQIAITQLKNKGKAAVSEILVPLELMCWNITTAPFVADACDLLGIPVAWRHTAKVNTAPVTDASKIELATLVNDLGNNWDESIG